METNTYMISEDRREEVEKLVAKYQRKAAKYNIHMEAELGKPYVEEVPVYEEGYGASVRVGTAKVEVFDLTISSDVIRNGNYTVVAKIEHLEDHKNIVYALSGNEVKDSWKHADCRCEHCGINRDRRLTFIVRDPDGNEKQIGKTCLKDYCGIDPQAIGMWRELTCIVCDMETDARTFDENRIYRRAYDTVEMIALANTIIKEQGYVKSDYPGSNRAVMQSKANGWRVTEAERLEAEEMAKVILNMTDEETAFSVLGNVKTLLEAGYCRSGHFGFIAYAPLAVKDYLKKMEAKRQREAKAETERKSSEYVGEIGKRIEFGVTEARLLSSWETDWGMTHLYKFTDLDGNVFVWFASSIIDEEDVHKVRGTVKDHNERDGIKQTVLTRCKVA